MLSGTTVRSEMENSCPDNVRELTPLLLEDLPSYSNRVIYRTRKITRGEDLNNYIITASPAEYEPLNLPLVKYDNKQDSSTEQIFFTVLERQYINQRIDELQTYHWLFLTQTESGWRMVMMFSRFDTKGEYKVPTPPKETSEGAIGKAVQLWLKDCRWGSLRS